MKRTHFLPAAALLVCASATGLAMADPSMETNRTYTTIYYTDSTRSVEAGREGVECGRTFFQQGARTAYSVTIDLECTGPVGFEEF